MPVTLSLPAVLTRLTDGARTIEASGATVGDVVHDVAGPVSRSSRRACATSRASRIPSSRST